MRDFENVKPQETKKKTTKTDSSRHAVVNDTVSQSCMHPSDERLTLSHLGLQTWSAAVQGKNVEIAAKCIEIEIKRKFSQVFESRRSR